MQTWKFLIGLFFLISGVGSLYFRFKNSGKTNNESTQFINDLVLGIVPIVSEFVVIIFGIIAIANSF